MPWLYLKSIKGGIRASCLIDPEDYPRFSKYQWSFHRGYAKRGHRVKGKQMMTYLHREIMDAKPGQQVDHVNGNRLDNRRCNLRFCTSQQNRWNSKGVPSRNRSGLKGVESRPTGRFTARIMVDGKKHYLGHFRTKEAAHRAYCNAAVRYHGEWANGGHGPLVKPEPTGAIAAANAAGEQPTF